MNPDIFSCSKRRRKKMRKRMSPSWECKYPYNNHFLIFMIIHGDHKCLHNTDLLASHKLRAPIEISRYVRYNPHLIPIKYWNKSLTTYHCGSDCHCCLSFLLVRHPLQHRAIKGRGRWAPWVHICKYLTTYTCRWGLKYWRIHVYSTCRYRRFAGLSCSKKKNGVRQYATTGNNKWRCMMWDLIVGLKQTLKIQKITVCGLRTYKVDVSMTVFGVSKQLMPTGLNVVRASGVGCGQWALLWQVITCADPVWWGQ